MECCLDLRKPISFLNPFFLLAGWVEDDFFNPSVFKITTVKFEHSEVLSEIRFIHLRVLLAEFKLVSIGIELTFAYIAVNGLSKVVTFS